MANNYCKSSSFINIPPDKLNQAKLIITKIVNELENSEDGYCGFSANTNPEGVWIHGEEYVNPEHVEILVSALVNELDLPGIHVCSWAYTCSKPRIDEFDGGAFAVQKDKDTIWIPSAATLAQNTAKSTNT